MTNIYEDVEDSKLLERFSKDRDSRAFEEVVRRYSGLVWRVAQSRLANEQAAKDVSQDVFLALANQASKVAQHPSVSAWLYRVALNKSCDFFRNEKKVHRLKAVLPKPEESMSEKSPERELLAEVDLEMEKLKPRERELLLLKYCEGFKYAEIRRKVGGTEESLRSQTRRALERLRKLLGARGISSTSALLMAAIGLFSGQAEGSQLDSEELAQEVLKEQQGGGWSLPIFKLSGLIHLMSWFLFSIIYH